METNATKEMEKIVKACSIQVFFITCLCPTCFEYQKSLIWRTVVIVFLRSRSWSQNNKTSAGHITLTPQRRQTYVLCPPDQHLTRPASAWWDSLNQNQNNFEHCHNLNSGNWKKIEDRKSPGTDVQQIEFPICKIICWKFLLFFKQISTLSAIQLQKHSLRQKSKSWSVILRKLNEQMW